MDYLGLFCLGAFVGTIATLGLRFIRDLDQWQKVLAAVLPAVLSGVAMVTVDRFKDSPAFGAYPLGLVAALMWAYIDEAIANITGVHQAAAPTGTDISVPKPGSSAQWWRRAIGIGHLGAATIVTGAAAAICIYPAWLQIEAEGTIEPSRRAELLWLEHRKAYLQSEPPTKNTVDSSSQNSQNSTKPLQ